MLWPHMPHTLASHAGTLKVPEWAKATSPSVPILPAALHCRYLLCLLEAVLSADPQPVCHATGPDLCPLPHQDQSIYSEQGKEGNTRKNTIKDYFSQVGRGEQSEIKRGDDEVYFHNSTKNRFMHALVGLLQNGTTAMSCLEINAEGNHPQLKGLVINSDRNKIVLNLSFLNHDRTLINKTIVYKIDKVPLWLARKIIDLCAMKIDPKNSLQPVANMKTGQILVTITIVCIETDPDDTLETSLRNPEMYKQNRSVVDCRVVRKAPANRKKNCSYDPLEPFEEIELEHHLQNKRGETWCFSPSQGPSTQSWATTPRSTWTCSLETC